MWLLQVFVTSSKLYHIYIYIFFKSYILQLAFKSVKSIFFLFNGHAVNRIQTVSHSLQDNRPYNFADKKTSPSVSKYPVYNVITKYQNLH